MNHNPMTRRKAPRGLAQIAYKALEQLLHHAECGECCHESTHRGGVIWTICDNCGQTWADDKGGFQPYVEPEPLRKAREALSEIRAPRRAKQRRGT